MILEVSALAFGFPGRSVGRDVSFSLAPGEVMCLLGPNGGGKTTLLRTILGLLPVQSGSIKIDGQEIHRLARAEVARRVGYVPQTHSAYFAFTVADFVLMGRTAHFGAFSVPGHTDRQAAAQALDALGIAALAKRSVNEISAGERQLALLARALAQAPKLLILDEPTAALDFGNQVRVLQKMSSLAAMGISILFSSHDPDHAFLAAHRALLLARGGVLASGTPREVIRPETLKRLYDVEVQVNESGVCLPALRR